MHKNLTHTLKEENVEEISLTAYVKILQWELFPLSCFLQRYGSTKIQVFSLSVRD